MTDALFDLPSIEPAAPALAPDPGSVRRSARLSDDGAYRYTLDRWWGIGGTALFVMLNPSTADADVDDPTIRRCMGFARTWGLDGIKVVNLYALRSTDPAGLWTADDPVGPDNDAVLRATAIVAGMRGWPVVAAWGANARPDRVAHVADLFATHRAPLQALGTTKAGQPRHPLYLRADAPLTPWSPA